MDFCRVSAFLVFVLALSACGSDPALTSVDVDVDAVYEIPEQVDDGLVTDRAAETGLNESLLTAMIQAVDDREVENMHSILIARGGKLVFEKYMPGTPIYGGYTVWSRDLPHNVHSVTKSFNSALVGIAVDQGLIALSDPVLSFFDDFGVAPDGAKGDITIEHALTMSAGLAWDETTYSYDDARNDNAAMYQWPHWVEYVLSKPMVSAPGTQFVYNSGISVTLGEIVQRVAGIPLSQFAGEYLFGPTRTQRAQWFVDEDGTVQTGGGLSVTPRDMVRLGLLYLNDGMWGDKRVISEDWVRTSTAQHGPNAAYAYQWWLTTYTVSDRTFDAFLAGGRGGQYIIVIRELDMVVVFTAGNDNSLASSQPRSLMTRFIVRSAL